MMSVLLFTFNEEANLPRCLQSVSWCDDVVVVDSYSADRTVEIARAAGARVIQRKFDNWGLHLNWVLENIEFRYPWVYYSDADEVVTPELRDELLSVTAVTNPDVVAYRVRYKNYFWGRWIKHCGIYPVWLTRLFRPSKVRWTRRVNQVPEVFGKEGRLENHFEHYSFNKGVRAWFEKHSRYAEQEAHENIDELKEGRMDWCGLFRARDPVRRRLALKKLSLRLPLRPTLRFFYMYVLRRGFMDGWAGLTYCRLLAIYEYMIVLNLKELRRREKGLPT